MTRKNFTGDDFERWRKEELAYLENLQPEPDEDVMRVAYVEALIALEEGQ